MLIGCGHIGYQHIEDIYDREGISVIAVIDSDINLAKDFAERFNAKSYGSDYLPFLDDPRIDIVIVATYTATHFEITRQCLLHKKHVICEKPIAANMQDATDFVRMVKSSDCKVTVSYVLRYNHSYQKIKEMIDNGEIGELRMIRMSQTHRAGGDHPWPRFLKLMHDCTPLVDCGVHYADVVQWFTNSKITRVCGISCKVDDDSPIDNYQIMNMQLDNGCAALYEVGWSKNIETNGEKEFIGTEGHISLTLAANRKDGVTDRDLIRITYKNGTTKTINYESVYKDMYSQLMNLIDMIENGGDGVVPIDAVYSAFRAVFTAQTAIQKGCVLCPEKEFPINL